MDTMDKLGALLGACMLLVLAWFVVAVIGLCFVTGDPETATVIDRSYKPSSFNTGTDSNGKTVVMSESEEYTVILSTDAGVTSVSVRAGTWAAARPGLIAAVHHRRFLGVGRYVIDSFSAPAVEAR